MAHRYHRHTQADVAASSTRRDRSADGADGNSWHHRAALGAAEYASRLEEVVLDRGSVDQLVMDYLEGAGYEEAATELAEESGATRTTAAGSVESRNRVRDSILQGDTEGALAQLRCEFPAVLGGTEGQDILFALRQQRLLDLVAASDAQAALDYAAEAVASPDMSSESLDTLERVLSLLAFADPKSSPHADLLASGSRRRDTATAVDQAILKTTGRPVVPELYSILKLVRFMEASTGRNLRYALFSLLHCPPCIVEACADARGENSGLTPLPLAHRIPTTQFSQYRRLDLHPVWPVVTKDGNTLLTRFQK